MKREFIPLGFKRLDQYNMRITLRYKTSKFKDSGLEKYCSHRYLDTGYCLFDITVPVNGPQHRDIDMIFNKLKLSKQAVLFFAQQPQKII